MLQTLICIGKIHIFIEVNPLSIKLQRVKNITQTVLEFAMANPKDLSQSELEAFVEKQDVLPVKSILDIDQGVYVKLEYTTEMKWVQEFQKSYIQFCDNISDFCRKNTLLEEFKLDNPENISKEQFAFFIRTQGFITVNDFNVSRSGIFGKFEEKTSYTLLQELSLEYKGFCKNPVSQEEAEEFIEKMTRPVTKNVSKPSFLSNLINRVKSIKFFS